MNAHAYILIRCATIRIISCFLVAFSSEYRAAEEPAHLSVARNRNWAREREEKRSELEDNENFLRKLTRFPGAS